MVADVRFIKPSVAESLLGRSDSSSIAWVGSGLVGREMFMVVHRVGKRSLGYPELSLMV